MQIQIMTIVFFLIFSNSVSAESIDYADRIQNKILNSSCIGCHGKFRVSIQNVDLTSYSKLVEHDGLVVPEKPDESLLFQKMMEGHGGLSKSEIEDLRFWIIEGANEN